MTTYYRIQPAGLQLLGHDSEDWSGETMPGRVCAYTSLEHLLSGYGDDWRDDALESCELIELTGRDHAWLAGCNAGVSVIPESEVSRSPLADWLESHGIDADEL